MGHRDTQTQDPQNFGSRTSKCSKPSTCKPVEAMDFLALGTFRLSHNTTAQWNNQGVSAARLRNTSPGSLAGSPRTKGCEAG